MTIWKADAKANGKASRKAEAFPKAESMAKSMTRKLNAKQTEKPFFLSFFLYKKELSTLLVAGAFRDAFQEPVGWLLARGTVAVLAACLLLAGCAPAVAEVDEAEAFSAEARDLPMEVAAEPQGAARVLAEAARWQAEMAERKAALEAERAEEQAALEAEPAAQEAWIEPSCGPGFDEGACEPAGSGGYSDDGFAELGVREHDGRTEKWYSSKALRHHRTGEWTVDDEGYYRTDDGYYVVAASDLPEGAVLETSKGEAMVLDSGCEDGTTDFYVAW